MGDQDPYAAIATPIQASGDPYASIAKPSAAPKSSMLDAKQPGTPAHAADELGELLAGAAKSAAKVSGPNLVYEAIRKNFPSLGLKPILGMPTTNEAMGTAVPMVLGGEEGAAETPAAKPAEAAPSTAANLFEHPAVTPWIGAMKRELMKIPMADFVKTAYESARGLAEGAPDAAPKPATAPPAPVPETNGIPWGSGGQGPLDMRGKTIPPTAESVSAPEPVPVATPATPKRAPSGSAAAAKNFKAVQQASALREIPQKVVDDAVPAQGDTLPLNMRTKSQVDFYLAKGDVGGAENALDTAAKKANPQWQPPDRPRVVPSVQNIRDRIAQTSEAEAQPNRITPDSQEDAAISQEMNWDLERHQWAAESEARREFIARNSTGVTKSELTGAAEKPVRYTKTPGVPGSGSGAEDLTAILQKSVEAAKKAKAQP